MPETIEDRTAAIKNAVKRTSKILIALVLLIILTLLFVNMRVLFTTFDDIPLYAVGVAVSIAAGLMLFGFYLARKISLSALDNLELYSRDIGNLLISKDREITNRREMEEILKKASREWRITFDSTKDVMMMLDREFRIIKVNRATTYFLDSSFPEILGKTCHQLFSNMEMPADILPLESMKETRNRVETEVYLSVKDVWIRISADPIFGEDRNINGAILTIRDITKRKRDEEKIHSLAYYDTLTRLPNRTFFNELVTRAIALAHRKERRLAILFIDLDSFKHINDTLGHTVGDRLLQAVSNRLVKMIRKSDFVSRQEANAKGSIITRLGGDEFIMLLNEIAHTHDAAKVAYRIHNEIASPFHVEGHEIFITASIGISLYPNDGADIEDLLKNADIAMYHAKKQGRNNFQFYSTTMNANALERMTLENKLRKALARQEFLLYYQPILSAQDRSIVGIEALIRWKQTEMGLVSPADFIPIAEETGLIVPIGNWVLNAACEQNKAWQKEGFQPIKISINLSSRQFEQKDLLQNITLALNKADLDPDFLELEITESAAMRVPERAIETLHKLQVMGIKVSIDDFGTGYSSLNYLRHLPVNSLKIDRSFVNNALTSPSDASIITAIISLAHNLNLKVVAEGVETEEQFDFLRSLNCNEMQGFLFSRPLPAEELSELFHESRRL